MRRRPTISTLFPYTTLFRSVVKDLVVLKHRHATLRAGKLVGILRRDDHEDSGGAFGGVLMVITPRSEEHTSELQSLRQLVFRLLLEKKNKFGSPPLSRCSVA